MRLIYIDLGRLICLLIYVVVEFISLVGENRHVNGEELRLIIYNHNIIDYN